MQSLAIAALESLLWQIFLGQHYNCEVLHLDKIHFTSNWQERTVDEMTDDISTFMLQRDWIIEGELLGLSL